MKWTFTGKESEPDDKHRISLGASIVTPPGIRYKVMYNEKGQILLDPVKSVPAYEAWIYENPSRIESIQKGIAQAQVGKVRKRKLKDK